MNLNGHCHGTGIFHRSISRRVTNECFWWNYFSLCDRCYSIIARKSKQGKGRGTTTFFRPTHVTEDRTNALELLQSCSHRYVICSFDDSWSAFTLYLHFCMSSNINWTNRTVVIYATPNTITWKFPYSMPLIYVNFRYWSNGAVEKTEIDKSRMCSQYKIWVTFFKTKTAMAYWSDLPVLQKYKWILTSIWICFYALTFGDVLSPYVLKNIVQCG